MEGGSVWEGIWKEVVCGRGYGRRSHVSLDPQVTWSAMATPI